MADAQDRWQLLTINPGFVMGPSLTDRKDSTSIDTILSFLDGKYASGIPDLTFGIVDVRDVADAHIKAAEMEGAKGRHILVNESKRFIEIAEILKKNFPQYKLPKSNIPKFLLYILGPFLGFSWKYISRNVGVALEFDNSWTKSNLDMSFIPIEKTLKDMVESMQKHDHT